MLWLLKMLIFGHVHKWKTVRSEPLHTPISGKSVRIGETVFLECEKCGIHKRQDLE